jgi:CRP-like cAMP-binding protein/glyoxylase-like metal-dependent hydrolase (beta-lactamase superfamily II)
MIKVKRIKSMQKIRKLPNCASIVNTSMGQILVNCPPETLKYLLAEDLDVPKIILIPPDVPVGQELGSSGFIHFGINYASIEFLLYANYFINGGQKTLVLTATEYQKQRLYQILQEAIAGPRDSIEYFPYPWVQKECEAMGYYPPLDRAPRPDDLVKIHSLDVDQHIPGGKVAIKQKENAYVFFEDGVEITRISTLIEETPMPLMLAPPSPLQRQEITLQFIGGSDGFDPEGITTCFLAYFGVTGNDTAILFDVAAFIRLRLGNLGIATSQISEVFISHVHEDHIAGLPELLLMGGNRIRLITSITIYRSLLRVLSAMLALPEDEIASLFDFSSLEPEQHLQIDGKNFESIYAIHTIPTLAVRVNGLCYSGDMRYDEEWFEELFEKGILSKTRKQELADFSKGTRVLVHDAGGGAVHTSPTTAVLDSLARKSKHIILTHAPKHNHLLPDKHQSDNNIVFAEHGLVKAIGQEIGLRGEAEKIETISVCPLYARLSISERSLLAQDVDIIDLHQGETFMMEGAVCDGSTYIVHKGLVELWLNKKRSQVVGRGTSVGERCALNFSDQTVSAKAHGDIQLLKINAKTFQTLAKRLGLRAAIERAEYLWNHPIFEKLPWVMLLDLALDFQPMQLPTGRLLFEYGRLGHECYMLISGSVAIIDKNLQQLGILENSGEFFGARSVLFNQPRNAYACIAEEAEIWALPAPALKRLQYVYPGVIMHLRAVELMRGGSGPLISALDSTI